MVELFEIKNIVLLLSFGMEIKDYVSYLMVCYFWGINYLKKIFDIIEIDSLLLFLFVLLKLISFECIVFYVL